MQNLCVEMQNMLSKACSPDEDNDSSHAAMDAARGSLPPWSPRGDGRSDDVAVDVAVPRTQQMRRSDGRGGGRSTQFPAAVESL